MGLPKTEFLKWEGVRKGQVIMSLKGADFCFGMNPGPVHLNKQVQLKLIGLISPNATTYLMSSQALKQVH